MKTFVTLPALLLATVSLAAEPTPTQPTGPVIGVSLANHYRAVRLPGAGGSVNLDYVAFDRAAGRLWVPAGDTGNVDVYDVATQHLTAIGGFRTAEREAHGHKRVMGPSSVALGDGTAYVGNRATSEVCGIDMGRLERKGCVALASAPDGIAWVGTTNEVWVTTPRDNSITLLDASLKPAGHVLLDGAPEGYAVDAAKGVFYTNLEDKDRTLAVDVRTRKVLSSWKPGCGQAGPRGVAVDPAMGLAFVACTDHLAVLDLAHEGAIVARGDTGAGVDNIDYLPDQHAVFVASGKASRLTVFHVGTGGALTIAATDITGEGCRSVVADAKGVAYLPDPNAGGFLIVTAPGK
jgi:DNA-binding beta-propeller fold protein YncE